MITGVDYTFISDISPNVMEDRFITKIRLLWRKPLIEEFERQGDRVELFFAKNKTMNRWHLQKGFSLDSNNEGCFMWCVRRIKGLKGKIRVLKWLEPKEMSDISSYNSYFSFTLIWEYSLVLPSLINQTKFSEKIYGYMTASLAE